jgi:hypothetical protein
VLCNLETIRQVSTGDYIALKFTGAGPAAVKVSEDFNRTESYSDIPEDKKRIDMNLEVLKNAVFEICAAAEK